MTNKDKCKKNMNDTFEVIEYEKVFYNINLDLKKKDEKTYDIALLLCHIKEVEKGFKAIKIYKTTQKGTKVKYATFKDREDYILYEDKIKLMVMDINKKYDLDILF